MVGSNPSSGSITTSIPVKIVPIDITYPGLPTFSTYTPFCGAGGVSGLTTITNSPLFQYYPFYASPSPFGGGQTFVGNTQYTDAFQRANFWDKVSATSPGYHVLLGPITTAATETINLTTDSATYSNVQTYCGVMPRLTLSNDTVVQNLITTVLHRPDTRTDTLYVFLLRNVELSTFGKLGEHSQGPATSPSWVKASIADPGIFQAPFQDVYMLAHELAEWMDDPYVNNSVPSCVGEPVLEVGDPVNGSTAFSVFSNGFTYTLPDLVFLTWFSRGAPNTASGGYTFFGANPPTSCSP